MRKVPMLRLFFEHDNFGGVSTPVTIVSHDAQSSSMKV